MKQLVVYIHGQGGSAAFAAGISAPLTVMPGGEHWFHTPEQMAFLDDWIRRSTN